MKTDNKDDFMYLFLQEQEKALKCQDGRGRSLHPLIIRWCFQLHTTSPKAYKLLRESGILTLQHSRIYVMTIVMTIAMTIVTALKLT